MRHHVDPFDYLKDILERLPTHLTKALGELMPDAWPKSPSSGATHGRFVTSESRRRFGGISYARLVSNGYEVRVLDQDEHMPVMTQFHAVLPGYEGDKPWKHVM
jgi:hypothetical protein